MHRYLGDEIAKHVSGLGRRHVGPSGPTVSDIQPDVMEITADVTLEKGRQGVA